MGKTFAEADSVLPDGALFLVQDISVKFGLEPTYTEDQFGSSQWTVLAACSSADSLEQSKSIEIAVAPTDAVSEQDLESARDGGYADTVACSF